MNIGIDARLYGLEHAGIGRYVKNIVDRVVDLDKKNHFTLFLTPNYFSQLNTPANVTKIITTTRHYSVSEQLIMPGLFKRSNLALLHVPHFNVPLRYNSPFIVTIHDILWHSQKGSAVTTLNPLTYAIKYVGYKKTVEHAITHAKAILTPSRFVKKQLSAFYSEALIEPKTKVIYEGVDEDLKSALRGVSLPERTQQVIQNTDFVVYVGSAYPHKNLTTLLTAIKIANVNRNTPIKLLLVSARSIFLNAVFKDIEANNLSHLVHHTGFLSDEQLVLLLSKSRALVQPSLSEGFGLTGLEAMALDVPVIAASSGALPEIYGPAALYFEPLNVPVLSELLQNSVDDPALAKSLINKGKLQVKKFSWDKAAQATLDLYHHTLKNLK